MVNAEGVALSEGRSEEWTPALEFAILCERPRDRDHGRQARSGSTKALVGAKQFRDFRLRRAYSDRLASPL